MAELTEEVRLARLRRKRVVLRAFNGAGLGVLLGGLIGAAIGCLGLGMFSMGGGSEALMLGALFGLLPGMLGGFWIGMTAVMRNGWRGVRAGVYVGAAVGFLEAFVVDYADGGQGWAAAYTLVTVPSGVLGGLVLSLLIRAIRARWKWWTRWEGTAPGEGTRV